MKAAEVSRAPVPTVDQPAMAREPSGSTGGLDHVTASAQEIAYLCDGASSFFRRAITPADVVWTYSGVRPLLDDGSGKPEAATRGYTLELSDETDGAPLLSVFGGKLTTYRHLAQDAVDALAARSTAIKGARWTDRAALPGGDFPVGTAPDQIARLQARYRFLEPAWAERLIHAYGTRAETILDGLQRLEDCGMHFGHGLTQREVDYLIVQEWARTAEDILWRRTKLGLRFSAEETARLSTYLNEKANA